MIKIERLTICNFRGIRDLSLNLNRQNFAVCGPNGTGKSGVVDALEFILTGTISRLSGRGRGDLSVKEHGPHVDARKSPEKCFVEAAIFIPGLGKKATIRRNLKSPRSPLISPDTPETRATLQAMEAHPEFALSRREIIRYILSEPGQRSKDVQELLRLEDLETVRSTLQRIANNCDGAVKRAEEDAFHTKNNLIRGLEIPIASPDQLLAAVNKRRAILSLARIDRLSATTSIRDGLATTTAGTTAQRLAKAQASADLATAETSLAGLDSDSVVAEFAKARAAVEALRDNEATLDGIARDEFLRVALQLFDGEACPVCDTTFDPTEFRTIVQQKQSRLEAATKARGEVEILLDPIAVKLRAVVGQLRAVTELPTRLGPVAGGIELGGPSDELESACQQLAKLLPIDATLAALGVVPQIIGAVRPKVRSLALAVAALPEPSDQEAAREYLVIGQERLDAYRRSQASLRESKQKAIISRRVFDVYVESTRASLLSIYQQVEQTFSAHYRQINADDEGQFTAKLAPSSGKLGLGVDFYTRGHFPPGAYHSEGHQDSMGLCLYLALVQYLLGSAFHFAVLDDVLMSVDAGHRREVCRLLQTQFPNTQFVLTTHDEIWLRHMKTSGLVAPNASIEFRKWTVEHGPAIWASAEVWDEIDAFLAANDVRAAAGLLRHYLEHLSGEYCQRLRARVEFRADGRHDLGDLLPPATTRLRELFREARLAAESWGDQARATRIKALEEAFASAVNASGVEQWQVNAAIHYNEWANLQRADFAPVVAAFRTLDERFACASCGDILRVTPSKGQREVLLCDCGNVSFSFKKKLHRSPAKQGGIVLDEGTVARTTTSAVGHPDLFGSVANGSSPAKD